MGNMKAHSILDASIGIAFLWVAKIVEARSAST